MGGQTALNCALSLNRMGVLEKFDVEMIGAKAAAIDKAEDRELFREAMQRIGLETPKAAFVNMHAMSKRLATAHASGMATADRQRAARGISPQCPHAGARGDAHHRAAGGRPALLHARRHRRRHRLHADELYELVLAGVDASPTNEVLIEESVARLERIRDGGRPRPRRQLHHRLLDREHRPDGRAYRRFITVAPALTLTDKEYQVMRDASIAVLREIGVETGGSNVQFAVNPANGEMVVIEMNPRVSRSSALASKATGFPIAKVAARLAVGYTLDELENDITQGAMPAAFEPTIDYVVTKIPALRVREISWRRAGAHHLDEVGRRGDGDRAEPSRSRCRRRCAGWRPDSPGSMKSRFPGLGLGDDENAVRAALAVPRPDRILQVAQALRLGFDVELIHESCRIDPWFLREMKRIVEWEARVREHGIPESATLLRQLKSLGFSDARLGKLAGRSEGEVRALRRRLGVEPVFKRVDTCAAEFAAPTAYMYSTYEAPFGGSVADEAQPSDRRKVIILGGGPNRIGQGIEFDYCCCHAAFALGEARHRVDHGQLQSGDRLDRLRHVGPTLFRAAHRRGRAGDRSRRAVVRRRCWA